MGEQLDKQLIKDETRHEFCALESTKVWDKKVAIRFFQININEKNFIKISLNHRILNELVA